jgi:hypothetical protein
MHPGSLQRTVRACYSLQLAYHLTARFLIADVYVLVLLSNRSTSVFNWMKYRICGDYSIQYVVNGTNTVALSPPPLRWCILAPWHFL